jgi:molybdenum cofactor cytidylyltransferase
MTKAFESSRRGIVVPEHEGRRGHPILFSAKYRHEVLTQFDDVGLRGLLEAHPEDVHEVAVADASILADMDVPEDYERELKRFESR